MATLSDPARAPRAAGFRRLFAVLFSVVLVVLGTGLWQIKESRRSVLSQVRAGNATAAHIAASAIGAEASSRRRSLQTLSGSSAQWDEGGDSWDVEFGEAARFMLLLYPDFARAAILDADGRVLGRAPGGGGLAEGLRGAELAAVLSSRETQVSAPFALPDGGGSAVWFSTAIRDGKGGLTFLLRLALPLRKFAVLDESVPRGDRASLLLVDRSGKVLAGAPATERVTDQDLLGAVSEHRSSGGEFPLPGREGVRLIATEEVDGTDWIVIAEQSRAAALMPMLALTTRLLAIFGVVVIVVLAAMLFISRLVRQLAEERNTSSAILASIGEGTVTADIDGTIISINPAMALFGGWDEAEVIGRHVSDVYALFDRGGQAIVPNHMSAAIEVGGPVVSHGQELSMARRDGRRVPVSVIASPINDAAGALLGSVGIFRDTSYEREVDQMKAALISTVSHELRTPLTLIQGFAELLQAGNVDPTQERAAIEQISTSAQRLTRMIDDLLSVARIESGKLVARSVPVEIEAAIEEALRPFRVSHPKRRFIVTVGDIPDASADPDLVHQVLTNLISNAVKYSRESSPVTIRAHRSSASLVVSVEDHGIGMSPEEQSRLFERFFRAERQEVRQAGGTGLGLYITKGLVHGQGGQVWVRSAIGKGTTFSFSIPVATLSLVKESV